MRSLGSQVRQLAIALLALAPSGCRDRDDSGDGAVGTETGSGSESSTGAPPEPIETWEECNAFIDEFIVPGETQECGEDIGLFTRWFTPSDARTCSGYYTEDPGIVLVQLDVDPLDPTTWEDPSVSLIQISGDAVPGSGFVGELVPPIPLSALVGTHTLTMRYGSLGEVVLFTLVPLSFVGVEDLTVTLTIDHAPSATEFATGGGSASGSLEWTGGTYYYSLGGDEYTPFAFDDARGSACFFGSALALPG